jgi:hypothetical protein
MDTDRNLLFGVLALQADLLDNDQFAEACSAWAARKDTPLADLLVERGWLTPDARALIDLLLKCLLKRHGGDAHASLAAVASPEVRRALDTVDDPEVAQSLASLPSAGRYRVLRPHARGGLGEVFVAQDTELHRPVALKQMQPRYADDAPKRNRFVLEAEVTGGLEHPGIVPVYGKGHYPDGRPFYAMRFIQGDSLQEALTRFHTAPDFRGAAFRQLLRRFVDVCNAVAYAHSRGCCTATSSQPTSCSAPSARRWWWTGASPRFSAAPAPVATARARNKRSSRPRCAVRRRRSPAASWGRPPT